MDDLHELDMQEPISPLHDIMFSKIFENMETAEAVKSLINAVLVDAGRSPVEEITSLSSQDVYIGATIAGRGCRLDVSAVAEGHLIDIEVQLGREARMIERAYYYGSMMMSSNAQRGMQTVQLPSLSMINIMDFSLRTGHADFHQPISLYYQKGQPEQASDILFIHNLELPKFRKIEIDKHNALHRWLYYFDRGYKTPDSPLVKEVLEMDDGLKQFVEKYNLSMDDPDLQKRYNDYRMAVLDHNLLMADAEARGEARGEAKGLSKGKAEATIELLRLAYRTGVDRSYVEKMALESGVSAEQAKRLYEEMQAERGNGKGRER